MVRLFLISVVFVTTLMIILFGIIFVIQGEYILIAGVPFLILGGSGCITFGVMLVQQIRNIFTSET